MIITVCRFMIHSGSLEAAIPLVSQKDITASAYENTYNDFAANNILLMHSCVDFCETDGSSFSRVVNERIEISPRRKTNSVVENDKKNYQTRSSQNIMICHYLADELFPQPSVDTFFFPFYWSEPTT